MRRADQFALQVVGPAVQRAHDVVGIAAAIEHQRLAVAADVGQHLDAVGVTHQHAAFVFRCQGGEVAHLRHHQFMADVTRPLPKQLLDLALQQRIVKVNIYRKLSARARQLGVGSQIGHPNPPYSRPKEEKESKDQYLTGGNTVFRTEPAIIPWNELYSLGPARGCGAQRHRNCRKGIVFMVFRVGALKCERSCN